MNSTTDHIINILPVVQSDELEGRQHGPHEVVEVGIPVVGVGPHTQACEVAGAMPGPRQVAADYRHLFVVNHPMG